MPHHVEAFRGAAAMPGGAAVFARSLSGARVYGSFLYAYLPWFGVLPLVLAALALASGAGRRSEELLWLLPPLWLFYSLPGASLAGSIPGLAMVLPRYFAPWISLGLGSLAARGLDHLSAHPRPLRPLLAGTLTWLVLALGAVLLAALLAHGDPRSWGPLPTFSARLAPLWLPATLLAAGLLASLGPRRHLGALLSLLLLLDLGIHAQRIRGGPRYRPPARDSVVALIPEGAQPAHRLVALGTTQWPNTALLTGLSDPQAILPLFVRRYRLFMGAAEPDLAQLYPTSVRIRKPRPLLRLASVQAYLAPAHWASTLRALPQEARGPTLILARDPGAAPRAYLAHAARVASSPGAALTALRHVGESALAWPIVEPDAASAAALAPLLTPRHAAEVPRVQAAAITRYEATEVVVHAAPIRPALLVLTDVYYPGWTATVDGAPAPIIPVNEAFRGVPLAAGEHEVRFVYAPPSLALGGALGAAGLLLCLLLCLPRRVRARSRVAAR